MLCLVPTPLPGPPVINYGKPVDPVAPGTSVELICRSLGTESDTQVIWRRGGNVMDNSYQIEVCITIVIVSLVDMCRHRCLSSFLIHLHVTQLIIYSDAEDTYWAQTVTPFKVGVNQGVRIEGVETPVSILGASSYSDSSWSILFLFY